MNRVPRKETGGYGFLLEVMARGGTEGVIEEQEARGQTSFVNSETLPTDIRGGDVTVLEAAGVVFGDLVDGDPIFRHVTLPDGWEKVATDHSMWSKLVDADGVERASIFYKAAFYDRSAFVSLPAPQPEGETK